MPRGLYLVEHLRGLPCSEPYLLPLGVSGGQLVHFPVVGLAAVLDIVVVHLVLLKPVDGEVILQYDYFHFLQEAGDEFAEPLELVLLFGVSSEGHELFDDFAELFHLPIPKIVCVFYQTFVLGLVFPEPVHFLSVNFV